MIRNTGRQLRCPRSSSSQVDFQLEPTLASAICNRQAFAFRRKLNLQRDAFRIAPQAFQRVKFAFLALKKVNDHVAVIEDDPLACGETILRNRFASESLPD